MLRSMYSGVAGLKVHQTRMDVIGNNIANVNTTAYKYQSINFSDVMYQTSQRASGATATTGGVNARQVGLGAINAAISTAIDQQGATQTTNNPFDMQISGSSFFIVNDGAGPKYTRDGSFYIDGEGNLAMQSTGYYVMGWGTYEDEDGALQVDKNGGIGRMALNTVEVQTYPAEATGAGTWSGNIDRNDIDVTSSAGKTVQYEYYDDKGYIYTVDFKIRDVRDAAGNIQPGLYSLELYDIVDSNTGQSIKYNPDDPANPFTFQELGINFGGNDYTPQAATPPASTAVTITPNDKNAIILKFNDTTGAYEGMYTSVDGSSSGGFTVPTGAQLITKDRNEVNGQATIASETGYMKQLLTFNEETARTGLTGVKGATQTTADAKSALLESMGTFKAGYYTPEPAGSDPTPRHIEFDFSTITNNNTDGRATIKTAKGNIRSGETGRKVGTLSGIQVALDGKVTASYTNGQTRLMGQIAAAQFANASGLEKQGENLYAATMNSGDAVVMDVSEDGGKMSTGVLEMSNVDLSNEFTSMITAQRGFQANSRIITVSDTLLEELTNLKR
ncbi:MAG: flagellar hook-basal body complex protein [Lachnospiraceae bacterium]|nr:flagellar hook-basal body complex protein [Lachnospiraceae bacterium]